MMSFESIPPTFSRTSLLLVSLMLGCSDASSGPSGDLEPSCEVDHGGCDALVSCVLVDGAIACGDCPSGYIGSGATACVDDDECADDPCDELTTCTNTVGGFTCSACPSGYAGSGTSGCIDVDECADDNGGCDPLVACANTPGGFTCGACLAGYTGGGASGCVDVDECAGDPCDELTTCTNTVGGFICTACPAGYAGTGETSCEDIDECTTGGCVATTATCTNTVGSFSCACTQGFHGDGYASGTGCTDVADTLHYRFDGTGIVVPNVASDPPPGAENAVLMGGVTQGSPGQCGGALVGTGASSVLGYLATQWLTQLDGVWTISFWTANVPQSGTVYYAFGDYDALQFRCFTGGVAGAGNWLIRATGSPDFSAPGGAAAGPTMTTFVADGTAGTLVAYVNGVVVNSVAGYAGVSNPSAFKVGGYYSSTSFPAGATMDEFRLYRRALSASEVADLYVSSSLCH